MRIKKFKPALTEHDRDYRKAIQDGDVEAIKRAIEAGISLRAQQNMTCMVKHAIKKRNHAVIEVIAPLYNNITLKNAMSDAAYIDDNTSTRILLDILKSRGNPQEGIAFGGNDHPIRQFIQNGNREGFLMAVEAFEINGKTIQTAAETKDPFFIKALTEEWFKRHPAAKELLFDFPDPPHQDAAACGNLEVLTYLFEKRTLSRQELNETLVLASDAGNKTGGEDCALFLIERGAGDRISATTALRDAAQNGLLRLIEKLIPLSDPKDNDSAALLLACENRQSEAVALLAPVSDVEAVKKTLQDTRDDETQQFLQSTLDAIRLKGKHLNDFATRVKHTTL